VASGPHSGWATPRSSTGASLPSPQASGRPSRSDAHFPAAWPA